MGWLRLVGSLKLQVSFAKETYKRDYILQKRYRILEDISHSDFFVMGWLLLLGSLKLDVSFAEYSLFNMAL